MIISDDIKAKYRPTIGIECHVQLKTATKLFAPIDNDAREADPNTKVSVICFGMPGVLPVLNRHAVDLAIRAGHALNAHINTRSSFDRKHYFYPDLPKGYQITQFAEPIVGPGVIHVPVGEEVVDVRITRAHLEEDAGKSIHPKGSDHSLVDLNRAGTPLLEIVSEPDMHTAAEARAYAEELYLLMKYAQVSEADLYHGNMRFDVNISVAPKDSTQLGNRAEVKNLNSFRSVERAVEYEVARQIELLEKGQTVVQETRGWDEDRSKTTSQRSKEDAHDYRYFPDPDIPPLLLDQATINEVAHQLPQLPAHYRKMFTDLGLEQGVIASLVGSPENSRLVASLVDEHGVDTAKRVALWLVNLLTNMGAKEISKTVFVELSQLVTDQKVSATAAKEIVLDLASNGGTAQGAAEKLGLLQESNVDALEPIVKQVLADNPQALADIKNGEAKAKGFLVGQIMKVTKGRANPQLVNQLIDKFM